MCCYSWEMVKSLLWKSRDTIMGKGMLEGAIPVHVQFKFSFSDSSVRVIVQEEWCGRGNALNDDGQHVKMLFNT